jgi:hypothetical protein
MEFFVGALLVELIGMNSSMMCDYIKFCADRLLIALGYQRHYKIGNLFEWMEMISLQGKRTSSKNALANTRNPVKEWIKLTRSWPLTPAFDPPFFLPTHLYFIPTSTCYTILCFQLETPDIPPSSQLLLPWLTETIHTDVMDAY